MNQRKVNTIIIALVCLLIFLIFSDRIVIMNGPATAAVVFRPFCGGIDTTEVYGEGVFLVFPWNDTYKFSVREQVVDTNLNIVVQNGVTVNVQINYRFWPVADSLPIIFRKYGENYKNIFVRPEVEAAAREVIAEFTPEDIYTKLYDPITKAAYRSAIDRLKKGNVRLANLMILNIKLPAKVVEAIEAKLQQQQLSREYDYRDTIAEKQKKIKIIEASAIRIAEDTINNGLTPQFLQFKQIEAFQNLSTSPNAKTIVIPRDLATPVLINGQ